MANWVLRNPEAFFLPMYEYFHTKLLKRGFVMADETPLQVLHEPERRAPVSYTHLDVYKRQVISFIPAPPVILS